MLVKNTYIKFPALQWLDSISKKSHKNKYNRFIKTTFKIIQETPVNNWTTLNLEISTHSFNKSIKR